MSGSAQASQGAGLERTHHHFGSTQLSKAGHRPAPIQGGGEDSSPQWEEPSGSQTQKQQRAAFHIQYTTMFSQYLFFGD